MGDAGFIINKYNTPPNVNLITVKRKNHSDAKRPCCAFGTRKNKIPKIIN